ncbi:MAG: DUF447 family protein [Promethearchaeota archaeon]|nr:MAG: DUF447 family protein [Candidatus Lokiarchaeota archaeon]
MNFNYKDFGLRKLNLYEVLAITFSVDDSVGKLVPNTAPMGIRFIENDILVIKPYSSTTTFRNLKENGHVIINFVDNIYLYALGALKERDSRIGLFEFPLKHYHYLDVNSLEIKLNILDHEKEFTEIPVINSAWLFLIGKAIEEKQIMKKNHLGEFKIAEFKIQVNSFLKQKNSYNLFNRAENLALEIIILATRLKVAKESNNKQLFYKIHEKIVDHMENMESFVKNKQAIKTIDLISQYMSSLMN